MVILTVKRLATAKILELTLLTEFREISSRRNLDKNQIKELPPGVLNNNSELINL